MKKLFLVAVIALSIGATSCKKDKTCGCTYGSAVDATDKTAVESTVATLNSASGSESASDAFKNACTAIGTVYSGTGATEAVTCTVK